MDPHSSPGPKGQGLSWAKAILLGEHAVVYGHPAVALPLRDLQIRATATPTSGPSWLRSLAYDGPLADCGPAFACVARAFAVAREFAGQSGQSFAITTSSDFPPGRGLGSSAAAAGAIVRAVLAACERPASAQELFDLTQAAETVAHGRPSGLDAAATCSPVPIRFQAGAMQPLSQGICGAHLVLADCGVQGSTRAAVLGLRQRYEARPQKFGPLICELGELAESGIRALAQGQAPALGAAMDRAHEVLAGLELSLPVLDKLTAAARQAGALGAKLTGGGLGGCVIALVDDAAIAKRVEAVLRAAGAASTWTYQMPTSEAEQ